LKRVHHVLSVADAWLNQSHTLRREQIDSYLRDHVAHHNHGLPDRPVSFDIMLGLALGREPTSDWDVLGRENPRKGIPTVRRTPRHRKTATGMRQDGSGPTQPLVANAGPHPPPRGRRTR
jgi:hypothetical protein